MADQTLKVVQSPVIADVQLPLPVMFNGLDQPVLPGYALTGDAVMKKGDTMSGRLNIETNNPPPGTHELQQTIALYVHNELTQADDAVSLRLFGIFVDTENLSSSSNQNLLVDLQVGVMVAS